MALITCSECSGKVSTDATACPHCGVPAAKQKGGKKKGGVGQALVGLVVLSMIASAALPDGPKSTTGVPSSAGSANTPQTVGASAGGKRSANANAVVPTTAAPMANAPAATASATTGSTSTAPTTGTTPTPVAPSPAATPLASKPTPSPLPARASIVPGVTPMAVSNKLRDAGLNEGTMWKQSRLDSSYYATQRCTFGDNEVSCLMESPTSDAITRIELEAEFYVPGMHTRPMLEQFARAVRVLYPDAPADLHAAVTQQQEWSNGAWTLKKHPHGAGAGYDYRLERSVR
jgi:hypothetical protein